MPTQEKPIDSGLRVYAFRLVPGQDLKQGMLAFVREKGLRAPVILTGVGSLTEVNLRFAGQKDGVARTGPFEIVSLVGLLDSERGHVHISVSDQAGVTIGGHLMDGSRVYTTAEIVIGEMTESVFGRERDETYGYRELVVRSR